MANADDRRSDTPAKGQRMTRLEEALRVNLKKRKALSQQRTAEPTPSASGTSEGGPPGAAAPPKSY